MAGLRTHVTQGQTSGGEESPAPGRTLTIPLKTTLQNSLPVIAVIAVMLLIGTIIYHIYAANRQGALALSDDLVAAMERRVAVQMHDYLSPGQQFAEFVDREVGGRPVPEGLRVAEDFALKNLNSIASVTAFSYADTQGNYLFVVTNSKGGLDSKVIDRSNGGRQVTWTRRNSYGQILTTVQDPSDDFDPRTRPWYLGAAKTRKPFWTDTYEFYTVHKPGITFSIPHFSADGHLQTVIGVDVELDSLCTYLAKIVIGLSGKAYIIDRAGRIVAFPSDTWDVAEGEGVKAPMLDEVNDPVLTEAYNRLRVEGVGRKVLDFASGRVIVSSEPTRILSGRDWFVLIVVPETDLTGFVAQSGLVALLLSILVVLIVIGLAGLLSWRNLQAGRRVAAATARQEALEFRSRSFVDLARDLTEDEAGVASLEKATTTAAVVCAARRVAIWQLSGDGRALTCKDYYDRAADEHTAGLVLHRDELPGLFSALDEGAVIDTAESRSDRRAKELLANHLKPLGVEDAYVVPIMLAGRPLGVLSVEEPQRGERTTGFKTFCDALAILLALRFGAGGAARTASPLASAARIAPAEETTPPDAFAARQARLERILIQHTASADALGQISSPRAAVGVVKLPDWTTVAHQPPDGGTRTAMDAIIHEVRGVIEQSGVDYAALLDDQIVIAAVSQGEGTAGQDAHRLAAALLELRDRLMQLEEKWGTNLDFRLAMDVGAVMSSAIATTPPSRNLWGGAVGVAKILATTTARHTIAASEQAYELLSSHFVVRPRGTYFLPETGNMRTFIVVGRV